MLRRSGFRRPEYTPAPAAPLRRIERAVSYAGTTTPAPKPQTYRDPVLLEMARGRRCLLLAVEGCQGASGLTTVACHRNEGKGMGQKQSDAYTTWGCVACHGWYDRSGAPRAEKRRAFMAAHLRQVLEWRRIATDPSEPERFRKAAQRALDELKATPLGDIT